MHFLKGMEARPAHHGSVLCKPGSGEQEGQILRVPYERRFHDLRQDKLCRKQGKSCNRNGGKQRYNVGPARSDKEKLQKIRHTEAGGREIKLHGKEDKPQAW